MHIWHGETFCSRVAQQLLKHFGLCGHQSAVGVDLERGEGRCPGADELCEAVGLKMPLLPSKQPKTGKQMLTNIWTPAWSLKGEHWQTWT